MTDVRYEKVVLEPGAALVRAAGVAGYFYHVLTGAMRVRRHGHAPLAAGLRETIVVGGFVAHCVHNESGDVLELLVGAEPLEYVAWMTAHPPIQFIDADRSNPLVRRLHLAIDLVLEELSGAPEWADQLTFERMAEVILFYFIRIGSPEPGKLEPYPWNDRRIMAAIRAMALDPVQDWTVDKLAKLAHMSRSAFAARFRRQLGETPMQMLTRIRLRAAAARMLQGSTIPEAAARFGYASDEAFNRAFKRTFGVTPGRWRRQVPPG